MDLSLLQVHKGWLAGFPTPPAASRIVLTLKVLARVMVHPVLIDNHAYAPVGGKSDGRPHRGNSRKAHEIFGKLPQDKLDGLCGRIERLETLNLVLHLLPGRQLPVDEAACFGTASIHQRLELSDGRLKSRVSIPSGTGFSTR